MHNINVNFDISVPTIQNICFLITGFVIGGLFMVLCVGFDDYLNKRNHKRRMIELNAGAEKTPTEIWQERNGIKI